MYAGTLQESEFFCCEFDITPLDQTVFVHIWNTQDNKAFEPIIKYTLLVFSSYHLVQTLSLYGEIVKYNVLILLLGYTNKDLLIH